MQSAHLTVAGGGRSPRPRRDRRELLLCVVRAVRVAHRDDLRDRISSCPGGRGGSGVTGGKTDPSSMRCDSYVLIASLPIPPSGNLLHVLHAP